MRTILLASCVSYSHYTHVGVENYLQSPVNRDVFTEAARQYYQTPLPLCPTNFADILDVLLLEKVGLTSDGINFLNCDHVFQVLAALLA